MLFFDDIYTETHEKNTFFDDIYTETHEKKRFSVIFILKHMRKQRFSVKYNGEKSKYIISVFTLHKRQYVNRHEFLVIKMLKFFNSASVVRKTKVKPKTLSYSSVFIQSGHNSLNRAQSGRKNFNRAKSSHNFLNRAQCGHKYLIRAQSLQNSLNWAQFGRSIKQLVFFFHLKTLNLLLPIICPSITLLLRCLPFNPIGNMCCP